MPGRIPINIELTEILWFTLRCNCGFESTRESIGLIGKNESTTDHLSYRVAWFDRASSELNSDDFRLPLKIDPIDIPSWLENNAISPVTDAYGHCLYAFEPQPFETPIRCIDCDNEKLVQHGKITQHRYIEYEPEFTIVENPKRKQQEKD